MLKNAIHLKKKESEGELNKKRPKNYKNDQQPQKGIAKTINVWIAISEVRNPQILFLQTLRPLRSYQSSWKRKCTKNYRRDVEDIFVMMNKTKLKANYDDLRPHIQNVWQKCLYIERKRVQKPIKTVLMGDYSCQKLYKNRT